MRKKSAIRYGRQDNSIPTEDFVVYSMMGVMGLDMYAIWTDFVPSAAWLHWGFYLSLIATLLVTVCFYWAVGTGRRKMQEGASRLKKAFALLFIPFFLFGIFWMALVHGLADIYTLAFGSEHKESVFLVKDLDRTRHSCDYQLEGEALERAFPDHICISSEAYSALPSYPVPAVLEGKSSPLGFHIHDVYGSLNTAVK